MASFRRRKVVTGPAPTQPGRPFTAPNPEAGSPYISPSKAWAPSLGSTQPTHLQVAADAAIGRPGFNPSDPDSMTNSGENPHEERVRRHNREEENVNLDEGWGIEQVRQGFAPDPKSIPAPTSRPTTSMSPSNYRFVVPDWQDNGIARHLTGEHFSMATNTRKYQIGGMAPVTSRRNTYRLEPVPRDIAIVDMPPGAPTHVDATYQSPEYPATAVNRSWRLM